MSKLFSKKLKQARLINKLTQNDLADRINVSRQTINNYESGLREPSLEILSKIIEVLNVSFDWLIDKAHFEISDNSLLNTVNISEKQYTEIFAAQLKSIRNIKTFTEQHCAKNLHISLPDYLHLEAGEFIPNLILLRKIANFFDVSIDWLCGRYEDLPVEKLILRKYIPAPYDENLRCRLIMLRTIYQYSAEDVAFFIKLDPKEYAKLENGQADPPVAVMLNLARLYKLPVESLSLNDNYFIEELKKRFLNFNEQQ